jgi:hypothetical protein
MGGVGREVRANTLNDNTESNTVRTSYLVNDFLRVT